MDAITTSAQGRQVLIDFNGQPDGLVITNQYPDATFSSNFGNLVVTTYQNYGTQAPNISRRNFSSYNHFAPLFADFRPVNDLRFHLLAADEIRTGIAQINIFQGGTQTATLTVKGFGLPFQPITIAVGPTYNNVTRIEVVNVNDYLGLAFDNFEFTVPDPTPTPTPTPSPAPTPPAAPTGLSATATNQNVSLSWTLSSGATGYHIKRATTSGGPYTLIAATSGPPYLDTMANGGKTHFYVVSALNGAGESPNSSQVSVSVPPACGDQALPLPTPTSIHSALSGWDMTVEVTANDGVVLRDISLNARYMAKSISVPYFTISTSTTQGVVRGELKPNSNDPVLRSRLVDYTPIDLGLLGVMVNAHYARQHWRKHRQQWRPQGRQYERQLE